MFIFTPGRKHNPIDGVGMWCDVAFDYLSRGSGCACSMMFFDIGSYWRLCWCRLVLIGIAN